MKIRENEEQKERDRKKEIRQWARKKREKVLQEKCLKTGLNEIRYFIGDLISGLEVNRTRVLPDANR